MDKRNGQNQAQSLVGRQVGPYKIHSLLGVGGMGEVYLAQDPRLDRGIALKILPTELASDPDRMRRFVREAKAASALKHPNVATIYEIGKSDEFHFIAMEYVEGQTLADKISGRPLPLAEIVDIGIQVADALEEAHRKGITHRDIKPANLMLTSREQVKILDFGLAKVTLPEGQVLGSDISTVMKTETGVVMGTMQYMSPEQVLGQEADHRTDIFSLGVVLYEMATGTLPFKGNTSAALSDAILHKQPTSPVHLNPDLPSELERIINRTLEKDRELRYQGTSDLGAELKCIQTGHEIKEPAPARKWTRMRFGSWQWPFVGAVAVTLFITAAIVGWAAWQQFAKARWARATALPEIARLVAQEELVAAFDLVRKAERYIPGDRELLALRAATSRPISIDTTPTGADVHYRHFGDKATAWRALGQTPVVEALIPRGFFEWRISKAGYVTGQDVGPGLFRPPNVVITSFKPSTVKTYVLEEPGSQPPGMVRVSLRGPLVLAIPGLEHLPPFELGDFWIDRYEVTNRAFKAFVDAGGYRDPRFWRQPFVMDGRPLSWDKALAVFRDKTGRPGPATWEFGSYSEGKDDEPVGGVSWYEAAAYAEFAGKMLPTIFHWSAVADRPATSAALIPLGRYRSAGPLPVGSSGAQSRYGTYDLAGNIKEWCWNEAGAGRRYTLGGGWNDPVYYFNDADGRLPWHRGASFGFRCMSLLPGERLPLRLVGAVEFIFRDFSRERPVSDEVFRAYASLYTYDHGELDARVQSVDDTARDWRQEVVTFNAAYGHERVMAYLILPKHAKPPFQTLVFFPGINALHTRSSSDGVRRMLDLSDFIVRSGRALVMPVYKDTHERVGEVTSDFPTTTMLFRDHVIMWSKDLQRTVDYLETRLDITHDKIGYLGRSWGSAMGAIMVATEPRLKLAIFNVGCFYFQRARPEVEAIHFAPRVKVPSLMLNGKYDFFFPADTSQLYMYRLLGVAEPHKRWVVYETSHDLPRTPMVNETLQWLDRYFGPVDAH